MIVKNVTVLNKKNEKEKKFVKGLHKAVVNELNNLFPTLGGSGSEMSHIIT